MVDIPKMMRSAGLQQINQNPRAYQAAARYLQAHNLERRVAKAEPCLIPVKCCLSGGSLKEEVVILPLMEKL